jgi:hypothetical protein
MVKVTKVELKGEYKIYLEFNDGTNGIIDLKNKLENDHREIIKELLNSELFKTAKINLNTVCWDNGVDFAPDYLYNKIKTREHVA